MIRDLEVAEELTCDNTVMTLTMCVNYGGRAEIADAAREIARRAAAGRLDPERITESTVARFLDEPDMPDAGGHTRARPRRPLAHQRARLGPSGLGADVVLRYTFPAGGLNDDALTTMLALILAGVESSRQGLVP